PDTLVGKQKLTEKLRRTRRRRRQLSLKLLRGRWLNTMPKHPYWSLCSRQRRSFLPPTCPPMLNSRSRRRKFRRKLTPNRLRRRKKSAFPNLRLKRPLLPHHRKLRNWLLSNKATRL